MLPNVNLARQLDYKKTHWMLNITAKVQVIIDTVDNAMTHETVSNWIMDLQGIQEQGYAGPTTVSGC